MIHNYYCKYHYIFEFHLLVDMYLFAFTPFILNFYSLISCSVFQFGSRSVFTIQEHAPYLLFYTLRIYTLSRSCFQGKLFVGIQKYFRVSHLQSFELCSLSTMQLQLQFWYGKLNNNNNREEDSDIRDTYHIPQLSQPYVIENSHFNSKLVSRQC